MKLRLFLSVITLIFCGLPNLVLATEKPARAAFLSVTDIHFSPFFDCPLFTKNCPIINKLNKANYQQWKDIFEKEGKKSPAYSYHNTNYALLQKTFAELQVVTKKDSPQFVVVLGDMLAHHFKKNYVKYTGDQSQVGYEAFVKKTFQFLTKEFKQSFPNLDVYSVVGNNDSYHGDYVVKPQGKFYSDLNAIWGSLIHNTDARSQFNQNFSKGGYYAITLPDHTKKLIILNSVMFSNHIPAKKIADASRQQLLWFDKQLEEAKQQNQAVIILDHIPQGIDVFSTLKAKLTQLKYFWREPETKEFEKDIKNVSQVKAILSGHIHAISFQLLADKTVEHVPVYFTPSVSPIYGNNPGFRMFFYDTHTFTILGTDTYEYVEDILSDKSHWQVNRN